MNFEELNYIAGIPTNVIEYAAEHCQGNPQFCSLVSNRNGELVIRTFGFQKLVRSELKITEVMRTSPAYKGAVTKNLYYTNMAGYRIAFTGKDIISKNYSYYGYGAVLFYGDQYEKWQYTDKPCGMTAPVINTEELFNIPKYKYCGYSRGNILEYTRAYNAHPEVEYMGKMGLVYKATLINKVKKDKGFIGFLKANVSDINLYGPAAAIYAYDKKTSIVSAWSYLDEIRHKQRAVSEYAPAVKNTGLNAVKVYDYCMEQERNTQLQVEMSFSGSCRTRHQILRIYNDYLTALLNIGGFDLTDTKNAFPNDLKRMHDLRVNQLASEKAKRDKAAKKELENKFIEKAKEAAGYAFSDGMYCVVIPEQIKDLVREGNALHHCVGRMGYDAKMARGETLIVFIRKANEPSKPYVTVEWQNKKVKQCYADHDSKPDDETRAFVDKWAEWMKRRVA